MATAARAHTERDLEFDVPADESALLVPVPAAEHTVSTWRGALDPSAARGVPAHVTVLYPFVPANLIDDRVVARLRTLFASCERFPFELGDVRWFDEAVVYLGVEPAGPFVALTRAVERAYPEHPPYAGAHEDLVPHLTLGMGNDVEALRVAARAVAPHLPIAARAEEVWLMTGGASVQTWRAHTRFRLAG